MNKVKVWGKEIDSCWKCYHHGHTDFDELCCSYTGTVIKSDINEDCPFSKPITKEIIESYGFEYIKTHPGTTEAYFELPDSEWGIDFDPDWNSKPFIRIYVFGCDGDTTHFSGIINNPVELEFIFKSIGVIE